MRLYRNFLHDVDAAIVIALAVAFIGALGMQFADSREMFYQAVALSLGAGLVAAVLGVLKWWLTP